MSYASAGLGSATAVRVGAAARGDVLLANASLDASRILLQATRKPAGVRRAYVKNRLNSIRQGLASEAFATRRRLVAQGKNADQATFDAMRLAIANAKIDEGIQSLREKTARGYFGAESFAGLGQMSDGDRTTGCAIASTAGTIGGVASVIPVYGTIVGAIVGIGSGIASGAMDCTRESREATAAATAAQANLLAVQQAAAARAAAEGSARTRMFLIGGGAIVAALGIGYVLLS
jgi:hypothetical protein